MAHIVVCLLQGRYWPVASTNVSVCGKAGKQGVMHVED